MPKVVDHDERRAHIARAAWAVLRRDGIDAVTVRVVAAEAGLSPGALRHYFGRHEELLLAVMQLAVDRITERIATLAWPADPLDRALLLVEQVVPLDKQRRDEMEVWLSFTERARHDPALLRASRRNHDALRTLALSAVAELGVADAAADLEADRLHAVIDGLALHAYLHPERLRRARIRAILRTHLQALCPPPDPQAPPRGNQGRYGG